MVAMEEGPTVFFQKKQIYICANYVLECHKPQHIMLSLKILKRYFVVIVPIFSGEAQQIGIFCPDCLAAMAFSLLASSFFLHEGPRVQGCCTGQPPCTDCFDTGQSPGVALVGKVFLSDTWSILVHNQKIQAKARENSKKKNTPYTPAR